MHSITIVDRKAYGTSGNVSRSLSARILENLEYLQEGGSISITRVNEGDLDTTFKASDIVIFSRHTSSESLSLAERARAAGAKTIYDLDDFMPALPSYVHHSDNQEVRDNIRKHVSAAALTTTSTLILKNHIDQHYQVSSVVVPTGINIERHLGKNPKSINEKKSVVYTNTDTIKLKSFKSGFVQTMNQYLTHHLDMNLHLVCDPNPEMDQFIRAKNWGSMDWFGHKKFLADRDYLFAVTPLGGAEDPADLIFNSCKSPIKYLDYGGLKIPGIYSKTPAYENFIEHMHTGILVSNDADDWKSALELLTRDQNLRDKIAKNAFEDVYERFHTQVTSKKWLEIFNQLLK